MTNGSTCLILNPLSLGYISALSVHSAGHRLIHYTAGHKPKSLDFVQAAAVPLTYGTAYEALVDRLEIKKGEKSGILIMNGGGGGGGVGSIASQIARNVLGLPLVVTTASRPETVEFSKKMGATHVVNHRKNTVGQIRQLNLPGDVPLRYAQITSRTEPYVVPIADVLAPFGKVCSIVQARFDMYGSQFMTKSLSFSWCCCAPARIMGTSTTTRRSTIAGSRSWPGCWLTALSNAISRGGSSSALRV